jgi:hypothetical protein
MFEQATAAFRTAEIMIDLHGQHTMVAQLSLDGLEQGKNTGKQAGGCKW